MEVVIDRMKGRMGRGTGKAHVDGKLVAEATILFAIAESEA